MATRFVQQATKALAPGYTAQQQAIESQVPAIQQLYQTLTTGLEGTRAAETQKILESASARGLTRSSIPTDLQTALGQSILQQQGQLGAQQAGEVAKVRTQLGELGVQRQQAIQALANQLYETDLRRQAQQFERQMAERKFQMERQNAERDFQMRMALSRGGGGGGGGYRGGGGGATAARGYSLSYKPNNAGYKFTGPNKKPISMAEYAAATGTGMVSLLMNSPSAYDKNALNYLNLYRALKPRASEQQQYNYLRKNFPALF